MDKHCHVLGRYVRYYVVVEVTDPEDPGGYRDTHALFVSADSEQEAIEAGLACVRDPDEVELLEDDEEAAT